MKNYIVISVFSFFLLLGCDEAKKKTLDTNQSTSTEIIQKDAINLTPSLENTETTTPIVVENYQEVALLIEPNTSVTDLENNSNEENEENEEIESNTSITEVENNSSVESEEEVLLDKDILKEEPSKQWYIRLVIEDLSNHLKTASTQLGQVDSSRAIEDFNLKALRPFGSRYLDVVFKNPIGMDAGEYKSDFHIVNNTVDTWNFTVKSHDTNAMMVLGYRGLFVLNPYIDSEDRERYTEVRMQRHPLLAEMVLIDISENKAIHVQLNGKMNEYLFSMNGQKEKHFRWEIQPLNTKDRSLRSSFVSKDSSEVVLNRLKIKAMRMDAQIQTKKKKKGNFDVLPPRFEVLVP